MPLVGNRSRSPSVVRHDGEGGSSAHGPESPIMGGQGVVSGPALQSSNKGGGLGGGFVQNAEIPSHVFPGGRNPYLNRPLPPPPRPKLLSVMPPPRPSTSGGPRPSMASGKPNFDKRMSRDDMFFSKPGEKPRFDKRMSRDDMYIRSQMASMAQFHIPARGQLLTPEHSPNSPPAPPVFAQVRADTPESLASGEIQIGMALGSPSHPPAAMSSWQPQVPTAPQAMATPEPAQTSSAPALQRTKTGRRRLFGGLFSSRKHTEPAVLKETQQEQTTSPSAFSSTTSAAVAPGFAEQRPPTRSNTTTKVKYKPIIIRSNTEPAAAEGHMLETNSPRILKTKASESSIRQPKSVNFAQPEMLRPPMPGPGLSSTMSSGPLLDVEIPNITMERYSVMFGSLLNTQQPASSLLARRQATLDKLKTINDKIVAEEEARLRQRRATSPQPAKSPAFTLFPPTPSGQTPLTPRRPSPRLRSNTSPALLPSPSKPNFDLASPRNHSIKGRPIAAPASQEVEARSRVPKQERGTDKPVHSINQGFHFGPDQSGLILESPTELEDGEEIIDSQPLKPDIPEPQWQMISPPTSAAPSTISSSANSKKSPQSSVSSVQTHVTRPSIDIEVDEADAALKTAVEISIARQISISRQQRQLLRPLQTDVMQTRGRASPASASKASPVGKLGKNERLNETKYSTPTLIHPKESFDSQLAQHRKSERVVLEAA